LTAVLVHLGSRRLHREAGLGRWSASTPGEQGAARIEGGPGPPGNLPAVALRIGDERRAPAPRPVGRGGHGGRASGDGSGEGHIDPVAGVDRASEGDARPSGRVAAPGRGLGGQVPQRKERQQDVAEEEPDPPAALGAALDISAAWFFTPLRSAHRRRAGQEPSGGRHAGRVRALVTSSAAFWTSL